MKKLKITLSILAALLLSVAAMSAQQLKSAYFLDGYTYRFKMNPAFGSSRGYFSMPAAGQLNVGVESNMGLSTFLYPTSDGRLTTFLNSSIPAATMESAILDENNLSVNVSTPVLSVGWWAKKTFHSIDLSVRTMADVSLPGDMFRFLKGTPSSNKEQPDVYNLGCVGAKADAFVELGYGFARTIKDWAHIGARIKFLVGAARANIYTDKFLITAQEDQWSIDSKVYMETSQLVDLGIDANNLPTFALNQNMLTNPVQKLSYGAALDFGLSFDFLKYFTISAAVLDVGFMTTPEMTRISTSGTPWIYKGLPEDIDINNTGNINDQLNTLVAGLESIYKFTDKTTIPSKTDMLAMTVNAGLEFRMPFWKRISIGLLSSSHINGNYIWTEGRASLNMNLTRWLGITGNYGISKFGNSAGAMLSIHARGFNLFVGTDSFLPFMEVTPQYVPVGKLNTNVTFGLNFTVGRCRSNLFAARKRAED